MSISRTRFAPLLAALCLAGGPALALEVQESIEIEVAPDRTWRQVADFCSIGQWHPQFRNCSIDLYEAATMRLVIPNDGGDPVFEEQLGKSDADRTLRYRTTATFLPVATFSSVIVVRPGADDDSSVVEWTGTFEPAEGTSDEEASRQISEFYQEGLAGLKQRLER